MKKVCSKCKKNLSTDMFSKCSSPKFKDGLQYQCKKCRSEYYEDHREKYLLLKKIHKTENPEENKIRKKKHYEKDKQKILNQSKSWRERNKGYRKKRYSEDILYRLRCIQRSRFTAWFGSKGVIKSSILHIGCSYDHLKQHLESKFLPGMSWDNYGFGENKWNIDHIIPLIAFNPENEQHRVLACHYMNLQPLWQNENFSKGGRYPHEKRED